MKKGDWMETYTGRRVYPLSMEEEDIDIVDIAHHLSQLCRFTGACKRMYTVAVHSLGVAEVVAQLGGTAKDELMGLLHDSAEAYINDLSRPLKRSLLDAGEIESRILGAVVRKYRLAGSNWEMVRKADEIMLATEALWLMPSRGEGWNLAQMPLPDNSPISARYIQVGIAHTEVERLFLSAFHYLSSSIAIGRE